MGYTVRRWHKLAGLGAVGVFALPATVSGEASTDSGSTAASPTRQRAEVIVDIFQDAVSNTGWNLQMNDTIQTNDTTQDANGSANGGAMRPATPARIPRPRPSAPVVPAAPQRPPTMRAATTSTVGRT